MAFTVGSTSAVSCDAVDTSRSWTTPGGTTGYITPEQNTLCSWRIRFRNSRVSNGSICRNTGVTRLWVLPMSNPLSVNDV